ncbi:MAG: DsbA family protein, partial [Candidatus Binatia bacterium]
MFIFRYWLATAILGFSLAQSAWAADLIYRPRSNPRDGNATVATADGKPLVRAQEINAAHSIQYYNLARELRSRQMTWLRGYIEERLLEGQAAKNKMTVEELLKKEAPPAPVTDGIIAQFLSERGRPGDKLTDQERKFLEEERRLVARREYIEKLWKEAKVEINLPEPEYPQVIVSEGNTSPVLGIEDGPVNIVEFCAFTSAPCRNAWKTLRDLVKQHGWRVRIVHRDYPLPNAPQSMTAAIAGRCAHRQGKFWPYHDMLYDNQEKLDDESLKTYAKDLKLDMAKFNQCFDKKETAQEIEWDVWEGKRVRLPALPALFANTIYI